MGLDTTHEHVVAVVHEVLRRNRGGDVVGCGCDEFCCRLTGDVLKDNLELGKFSNNFLEVGLDEELLSVEDINRRVGDFPVNQER